MKAVLAAGMTLRSIPNKLEGDELRTDVDGVEEAIKECGASNVLCILSTTSCFAPRGCDRIEALARICKTAGVPHVINNAYGLQVGTCSFLPRPLSSLASAHSNNILCHFSLHILSTLPTPLPTRTSCSKC